MSNPAPLSLSAAIRVLRTHIDGLEHRFEVPIASPRWSARDYEAVMVVLAELIPNGPEAQMLQDSNDESIGAL